MALYTRYVSYVDSATGDDTRASGSSASIKDSDVASGTTVTVTNNAGGSTVVRDDAAAFSGPPLTSDTIFIGGALNAVYHIAAVSGDTKTLTLRETPATTATVATWGVGGAFASVDRAMTVVTPTTANGGGDDHVYIKAATYAKTTAIAWAKSGTPSRRLVLEGYTTTPGDGGRATIDYSGSGASTNAVTDTGSHHTLRNCAVTGSGTGNFVYSLRHTTGNYVTLENCDANRVSGGGTANYGFYATNGDTVIRCRARGPSTFTLHGDPIGDALFNIFHDITGAGTYAAHFLGHLLFCIADTPAVSGFNATAATRACGAMFCIAYNAGTDGILFPDTANRLLTTVLGCILANNGGYGFNIAGLASRTAPVGVEAYNDFYANASGARQNVEDTTGYDATPTDTALDPQFTDAPNQDFTIGANLKAAAAVAFQVGGTTLGF